MCVVFVCQATSSSSLSLSVAQTMPQVFFFNFFWSCCPRRPKRENEAAMSAAQGVGAGQICVFFKLFMAASGKRQS